MLSALITAQHAQPLFLMDMNNMFFGKRSYTLIIITGHVETKLCFDLCELKPWVNNYFEQVSYERANTRYL